MSKTNCINCGAAKDIDDIKCPFCGTTYLDMTAIDFTSDDPVVCQFVMPYCKGRTTVSMLARPRLDNFEMQTETMDIVGPGGTPLAYVRTDTNINLGVSFRPVIRKDSNTLMEIKYEP